MPPRVPSAETAATPEAIAKAIADFFAQHTAAAVLEDGKVAFDLRISKFSLTTEHGRCTLHLWNEARNTVRTVESFVERHGTLRLATARFGQPQTKLLELVPSRERRTPNTKETARVRYVALLERVLARQFPEWNCEGFRTAMDLERSFGPAYTRGMMVKGNQAWAVIGVNEDETATTIDGILTLGVLWLHHCREHAAGKKLFQGLKLVLPRGAAALTLSRLAWMNPDMAKWELYELQQSTEELLERDAADVGNLRTRLVHHPDEVAARERFAAAIEQIRTLVPDGEWERVDQHLKSTAELVFQLHGLEFARARVSLAPNSFANTLEVSVGVGAEETLLTDRTREMLVVHLAELFRRRRAVETTGYFTRHGQPPTRRIGIQRENAAHSRIHALPQKRVRALNPAQDPLYRAVPERWLESVLKRDLSPLTRGLASSSAAQPRKRIPVADDDEDNFGNRADDAIATPHKSEARVIPRLNAEFVYSQVPAIAGASDRGMLDLMALTADGRIAVIELKADEDLHFALQGLDYWIRVRQHHLANADTATGLGEFQRHGYFVGAELSPLAPRLYLVAPALRIHPAVETVLRYLSPRVEWQLLALDERWRENVRVVWRKSGGRG